MQFESNEYAADFRALAQLSDVFLQLVAVLHDGGSGGMSPSQVITLAARCMPRGRAAAISAQIDGRLQIVAATGPVAQITDRIRTETGEGPVLDAVETNDVVISSVLEEDPRWPTFGRRVAEETEVTAVATYRLYLGPSVRGALTFYSEWPYAFDDIAISTGAIFAAYASLALQHEFVMKGRVPYARARSVQMEIGVAVGILMSQDESDVDSAYQRLHSASRVLQESVPKTAADLVADANRRGDPAA